MQDEVLMEITKVVDDSTGIWEVGEVEWGIKGTLDGYIKEHGYDGVKQLLCALGHLSYEVKDRYYKLCPPDLTQKAVDRTGGTP